VGIVLSNTRPLMPPPGGAEALVGNNPIAVALPSAGEFPVEADMALSATAMGKIRLAAAAGQRIPEDWAVDSEGRPTTDPTAASWDRVLRINLDGVVWCYQAVIAGMIARRSGSIIAFTSGLAHQGWPGAAAYAASKAALIAFAKSAAKEIARHRVRFNLVAPGVIDTPQYRAANAGADDARWRVLAKALRVDEIGDVERATNTARPSVQTALLSDDTRYPFRDQHAAASPRTDLARGDR
jgi:NAD(P)-dependent dehydrogenase (short-subunit alcohol dehydrogenase family)